MQPKVRATTGCKSAKVVRESLRSLTLRKSHVKVTVGIVEGRPEGELISDLASGALKAARRDGAWRRAIPPPLPADAGPAKVLEHCLDHARDLLAKPARWSPVERAWFAALQRWCQLLQSGGTVRRRSRGLLRTKTVLVEKVETPPEGSDEGPEPPPAWIIRLRHDDPQPVRPSEIGPELAEPPPTALPEVSLSGLGAPPPREDEPESPEAGEARRARTGFRTALENQFLPWANRQLIPDDRVSLVAALKSNLGSDAPAAQDVAGLLGFTHVTGQLIEQAALIDRTPAPDRSYLSDRVYMRYVAPQEGAWEPDDRQRLMLRPRATHVPLLLPSEVSDWLDRRLPVGVTLSEALGTTPVGARSRAREWLTALRESTGGLQSLSRVEWWLAQALYQPGPANGERADHVRPHLACGVTDGQPCPSAYYRAYEVNEVAALHREVLSDAGWTMPEAAAVQPGERRWVGSQLNLDLAQVKDLWARVTQSFQQKVQDPQAPLHVRHNARELHECFSLVFQTLHRVVTDPLESLEFIDLQTRRLAVDDKSQGDARAHRVVPLTQLAVAQCQDQIEHVGRLAMAVAPTAPATAHTLLTMIEHPEWRVAPFRFLLDERLEIVRITPAALIAELESVWGLPLNLARHFSSTWLLEHGATDEALCSLLGHTDLGTQNLSLLSPRDFDGLYRTLIPLLDELVSALKMQSIPTFLPAVEASARPARSRARPSEMPFGHRRREQVRFRQFASLATTSQLWIQEQLSSRGKDKLNQDDVDALFERVRKETANRRSFWGNARFEAMRAALVEILRKHEDLKLDLPAIALTIKDVSHICPMDGLASARWLAQLRAAVHQYWDGERDRWRAAGTQPYVAAADAIVLTLVVDSLVIDPDLWKCWLASDRALRPFVDENDQAWIRLPLSNGNSRLYPVRREWGELIAGVTADSWAGLTFEQVVGLANQLSASWHAGRAVKDFSQLLNRVQGGSAAQMPGLVLGFADGSHSSVSPEDMCLERRAGQAPTLASLEAWQLQKQCPEVADLIGVAGVVSQAGNGHLADQAEFRKRMSKALQLMDRDAYAKRDKPKRRQKAKPADDGKPAPDASQRKAGRGPGPVRRFVEAIEGQWDELVDSPQLSPMCGLSARWIHKLADAGKQDGKDYASKTLRNYWYSWALRAIEEFGPMDPREMSPAECEEMYLQIVEDADVDNRQHLYAPMRNLHRYLVLEHRVPEIEWSELRQATGHGLTYVDANLVFKAEYLRALDLLRHDEAVSPRVRAMQATVLVLVYRFGLRIAECLGLRGSDIRFDNESGRWSVRVRGNQYRSLKTVNARRTVVALEDLSDIEQGVLESWSTHVAAFAESGDVGPLFASAAAGNQRVQLFPRRVIALRVAQALRIATGDPSIRIHHCRHTYATRILHCGLGFVFDPTSDAAAVESHRHLVEQIRRTLTQESEPTRRLVWAVAVVLGHSNPLTGLETYCHFGHEWLRDWCDRHLWSKPKRPDPAEDMAWSAGVARKTMQRDVQRHKSLDPAKRLERALVLWSRIALLGEGPRVQRDTSLPPLKLVEGKNTLISADRIVDHARRLGRVDGLAQALFVSEQWVEHVLLAAKDFAARHHTLRTPPQQWWLEGSDVGYPEHEAKQIDRALETLEKVDPSELKAHCEVLERYLAPAAKMLVIESADTLERAWKLTRLLVEEAEHIQLLLPAKLPRRLTPAERELRDKEARRRAELLNRPYRPKKPRLHHEKSIDAEGIDELLKLAKRLKIRVDKHGRVAGTRDAAHDWLNPGARLGLRVMENATDVLRSSKVFVRVLASTVVAQKALELLAQTQASHVLP